jgi:predicted membrane-bound mannosyltransferase/DNA-binding beta-propeller fold protein YncE
MVTTNSSNNWLQRLFARSYTLNWEVVVYLVIFGLAIFTRFYDLGSRVMSHDESLHTRFSYNLATDGDFAHTPLMHGPILFHAVAFFYTLFGDSDFTARIYTSLVGILLVMSPLLFRRWLGRWGAILACLMMLISPLIMYYGRYIREDTPALFSAVLMFWSMMMYLNGPEEQRRRSHWLYLLAFAMIWNLGTKETAFIYIAIIGIFLVLYWAARLLQHFGRFPAKPIYYIGMMGILLGGVMSLGMYIVLDVVQFDMFSPAVGRSFYELTSAMQGTFIAWSVVVFMAVLSVLLVTMLFAYRGKFSQIPWGEFLAILGIALIVCFAFVVLEEFSHVENAAEAVDVSTIRWWPMWATWGVAIAGFGFLFYTRRKDNFNGSDEKDKYGRGFWGTIDLFPEADLIVVIGSLILPWATAFIPYLMKATPTDYSDIAAKIPPEIFQFISTYIPNVGTGANVGHFIVAFMAFVPLLALSLAVGFMWDWKRYGVIVAIFYSLFAFFFTTVFTNMAGLGSGIYYSLGYWLEQQGERRGSQPQYYYLLVIMPFYEFLPVIGSMASMAVGLNGFWKWRRKDNLARVELRQIEAARFAHQPILGEDGEALPMDTSEVDAIVEQEAEGSELAHVDEVALHRQRDKAHLDGLPFLIFFSWLGILNLLAYSLAGEKMPWLGTHLTLPLIFITGWFFGGIFSRIKWESLQGRGGLVAVAVLVFFVGLFQSLRPLFMGTRPFSGLEADSLAVTYAWVAAVVITGGALSAIFYFMERIEWRQVARVVGVVLFAGLSFLTLRSALMASFVNYDYATEFLVYAHSSGAVKDVLEEIEDISLRTTDGYGLAFAYDNEVSWPYSWYFRNFTNVTYVGENPSRQNLENAVVVVVGAANRSKVEPILEDRYIRFDYIRLWWPMQEYFYLTPERTYNLFDLTNSGSAQLRQGIFDIWWNRDYTTYGLATGKDFTISNWPVSDRMHMYVRRDIAAQIWPYGVGDGTVTNPLNEANVNQCTANWVDMSAVASLQAPSALVNPLGIAVSPDGLVYVAEEFGQRISVFDTNGNFIRSIGQEGAAPSDANGIYLSRPNAVAVASDGSLVVADTWNFRIQYLSPDYSPITTWGQPLTTGFGAPVEPMDGFWGPRSVAITADNRVYVSDTGNKRIRVYQLLDGTATFIMDISSGGSGVGQIDEPSGLAIHPDGRLFVADTWNRRISVFTTEGVFLDTYAVRGWYEEQGNRPYLAVDPERELLYVTDPDAGRVLVYTTSGDCVGSFGQSAGTEPTLGQFGIAAGIAVDADGYVYVADSRLGRVLKFDPFPYTEPVVQPETSQELLVPILPETSLEAELTEEIILPETTAEAQE